jgi:hypothetical protein
MPPRFCGQYPLRESNPCCRTENPTEVFRYPFIAKRFRFFRFSLSAPYLHGFYAIGGMIVQGLHYDPLALSVSLVAQISHALPIVA